jgi:hypothetical protein
MNQETKTNRILEFFKENFKLILSVFLSVHILIGFSFLLYNHHKKDKLEYKYEIINKDTNYKSNEVYFGEKFILFFNGDAGTYEDNEKTIKIYSDYQIDTIGVSIKVTIK